MAKAPNAKAPRRRRSRSKNDRITTKAQGRRIEALTYRIAGYTYEQIGEAMNVRRQRAWEMVDEEVKARAHERRELGDQLRLIMTERYERMIQRLWKLVYPTDGVVDLKALDRLIKVQDRLCDMYGINEPQRIVLDIRAADAMVMTVAQISMRYIAEHNRQPYIAELRSLVSRVEQEHAKIAQQLPALVGRVG